MCNKSKQRVNYLTAGIIILVIMYGVDFLISAARADTLTAEAQLGGVALGENLGGVMDRIYVAAPPNWQFAVSLQPGSFLDCGTGMEVSQTDANGRRAFPVTCGVTLKETLIIPSASKPARLVIHY